MTRYGEGIYGAGIYGAGVLGTPPPFLDAVATLDSSDAKEASSGFEGAASGAGD